MKQITKNTVLNQGDKTYQPVEVDGAIYWVDKSAERYPNYFYTGGTDFYKDSFILPPEDYEMIVAQSQLKLDGVPVISLDNIECRHKFGTLSNPNQYTQKDIEKAFHTGRLYQGREGDTTISQLIKKLNSISVIQVDEQFNIVSYE